MSTFLASFQRWPFHFDRFRHGASRVYNHTLLKMNLVSTIAFYLQVWAMLAASGKAQEVVLPENLDVPVGYTLYQCADIVGQQIYEFIDSQWNLLEPSAVLFDPSTDPSKAIGTFQAGPTWEFDNGKTIEAQRLLAQKTVDQNSLDWLLIEGVVAPGEYEYIKQTDTVGGLLPPFASSYSFSYSFAPASMSMSSSYSYAQPMIPTIGVPFSAKHCFYRRTAPAL